MQLSTWTIIGLIYSRQGGWQLKMQLFEENKIKFQYKVVCSVGFNLRLILLFLVD